MIQVGLTEYQAELLLFAVEDSAAKYRKKAEKNNKELYLRRVKELTSVEHSIKAQLDKDRSAR